MHNNCQQLDETLTQQPLIFAFCPALSQNEVVDIVRHSCTWTPYHSKVRILLYILTCHPEWQVGRNGNRTWRE